ncbi:MAG TPA: ABC transporter permease [Terriglobia bacterium]|nr:ABC transporter permease [Terriglobia bacterium]
MDTLVADLRYGLRMLGRKPGFTAVAVLTLALGIGANTAMFTVIDAVLLRPLSFPQADRLMALNTGVIHGNLETTSWPNYADVRDQSRLLEDVSGYFEDLGVVNTSDGSKAVWTVKLTASLLDLLRVRPELGRPILPSDNQPGAPPVVMLSDGLWRQDFGADPHVLGTEIRVGEVPHTIVGVMPPGVPFPHNQPDGAGVWLAFSPTHDMLTDRGSGFLYMVGRLRPGVSRPAAQAELNSIARGIRDKDPDDAAKLAFTLVPYRDVVTASVRPVLLALAGALVLVLVIACVNVANLLLARWLARRQELAVRVALGAGRGRLARQVMSEGALLSLAGALAGLELASLILQAARHLPSGLIPRAEEIHLRLPVFLALVGFAALATILSSLAPALLAMRTDPDEVVRGAARGSTGGRKRSRVAGWMVMAEVALSALLLVSTGLMFRTLYNLENVHLGFDPARVTSFMAVPANSAGFLALSPAAGASNGSVATRVYEPVLERLRHLPGVIDAAVVSAPPLAPFDMHTDFEIVGQPQSKQWREQNRVLIRALGGNYNRVLGEPVVRGRAIAGGDTAGAPYVAVINEAFARSYFPGQNPIGHQLSLGGKETGMVQPYTVVGVVSDAVQLGLSQATEPELDLPVQQVPADSFYYSVLVSFATHYVLKTQGGINVDNAVRQVFRQEAPDYALDNFQTLRAALDNASFNQRLGLYLIGSFAAIAVAMVLAGLYGVLSQLVGQRRREIGVRMALGATRESILRLILRQGAGLILTGLAVGLVASLASGRLIRGFLFGVTPTDVWTYLAVAVALAAVGMGAALLPARRAAQTDPMEALRCQ